MGFWHTGYMEFHEPAGLSFTYQPSKVHFSCQHCEEKFDAMEELRRHRFEARLQVSPRVKGQFKNNNMGRGDFGAAASHGVLSMNRDNRTRVVVLQVRAQQ